MKLENTVALITGGTKGIGAATAVALARLGADVAITGRGADAEARQTCEAIRQLNRRCELIVADSAVAQENTRVVNETVAKLGKLNVVVHSAGGPVNGKLFEITPEQWHGAFDVHVHAVFYLCRAAIPEIRRQGAGAIVLVSSTAGIRGVATNIAYQAAKGALPQLTRALAREFADENIRVNCVAPGVIRTAFHKTMSEAQKKLNLEQRIPLHREGTPEQVASLIEQLITNDYLTGETFTIDGGLTMRIA